MSYKKLKKPLAPQACPIYIAATGSLAQLVERFVYTEDVGSSSLSRPTSPPPPHHARDSQNRLSPSHGVYLLNSPF